MKEIQISVRNLVEFILRSGDIDRRRSVADNAMQEGSRIHRMIQKRMGSDYHAEVSLKHTIETKKYRLVIEGRADGMILQGDEDIVTVDEIKGTYREIGKLKAPVEVHLAQAKCYAYIYGLQQQKNAMRVRMTYCQIETEELRYFQYEYGMEELTKWFLEIVNAYQKWADYQFDWEEKRTESIKAMPFPYEYREGQKELVTYVYQTIYHRRKLFLEAPTGVGKTLSTIFPAIKAMGEGLTEKLFYLTAKTITRTVAENAIRIMRKQGLAFKSVTLTARDKICPLEEVKCNPEHCIYAKGHYDRINDALYHLLTESDNFDRETIAGYAQKYRVCPFEMGLDVSLFSDAVIGDYNYLFDPHVYLRRFFTEGSKRDFVFLIDEAHNLVDRGREMYSAVLVKEDFLTLKKTIKDNAPRLVRQLEQCNRELLTLKRGCEGYCYEEPSSIAAFVRTLERLAAGIEDYLDEQENSPVKEEILEFYFGVSHFLMIHEILDQSYEIYSRINESGEFVLKLLCVNPAGNLQDCMHRGRSSILFSATLLPIGYYKRLLGAEDGDYEVYARSVFDPKKRGLFLATDVTSKYSRRSDSEYYKIASYIDRIIRQKKGNYMVFFPSYSFLREVGISFEEHYLCHYREEQRITCIYQDELMRETDREEFLKCFEENEQEETLVGFCVLGGIFSEGIDLKNDSLIGAIIVGTGLPLVWCEKEILKDYFEEEGENGFDYAYRYPGMNKVLQAAGRVIRTASDTGIVVLLDERFLTNAYLRLFPREWKEFTRITLENTAPLVQNFWKEITKEELRNKE